MDESKRTKIHPRQAYFQKRKTDLEFALRFMRGKAHQAKIDNDPCYELYAVAADCVGKELTRIIREC